MVQTLGIDANNDVYIGSDGNLAVLSGLAAVEGACQTIAQAQLGEMVLFVTKGLPTRETIWNGNPKVALYEAYLRAALESVSGVVAVTELTYNVSNGVFSYTATIETIFGSLYLNGQ